MLAFATEQVIPHLVRTTGDLDVFVHALARRFIHAGPFGSPLRGLVNVLEARRTFYTVAHRGG